jgi:hypothetical protein
MGQIVVQKLFENGIIGGKPAAVNFYWNNPVPGAVYAISVEILTSLLGPTEKYLEVGPLGYYRSSSDPNSASQVYFTIKSLRDGSAAFNLYRSTATP